MRETIGIYETYIKGLVKWLKDYNEKNGLSGYVIGLSGGIDSAVAASLAVRAVGPENVIGVSLPCQSEEIDNNLAEILANNLGIGLRCINLNDSFNVLWDDYCPPSSPFTPLNKKLTAANIKARLRMTILYAIAGDTNKLVLGTTNKTEAILGYFTKYGDGAVDVEPLQEFYKTEVYRLAELLTDIPKEIITRPPTAGLWTGQTDEDELGFSYPIIDEYLISIENNWTTRLNPKLMNKIDNLIIANTHKRALPPYPTIEEILNNGR